jgi:putative spermidine/putrescine transport system ATP-binding protein
MPSLELIGVGKRFKDHVAVSGINLRIADGEYATLLGPSGCGKTTLLRMMAGLIDPDEGDILVDGKSQLGIPPEDRNIGYLFQNYALFPHMDVEDNVGYGPQVRGDFRAQVKEAADDMLRFVKLLEWAGYMPNELSGGMRQRVALARSLAAGSKILFLDEPMSSLDPKIGVTLRYELKRTAKCLGLTVIHVTHDQADAMSISDRVIVMRRGAIAQVGKPKEVYYRPVSPYVAHFIGETNFLKAEPADANTLLVGGRTLEVEEDVLGKKNVVAAIRPEKIIFASRLENTFEGVVKSVNFMGPTTKFMVDAGGISFAVSTAKFPELQAGSRVSVYLPPKDIRVFHGVANLEEELRIL